MKNHFKKYYHIYAILFVLGIIFLPILLSGKTIIFYGDSLEQMLSFYMAGYEKVHSGTLGFWDWSNGLGANQFTAVYYYLTSPFFWISCLFDKNSLPMVFEILIIIKLFLIYIFAYLWLKKLFNKKLSVIGALLLTLNGWTLFVFQYNLFFEGYLFYFICLYFYEKKIQDNSKLFPIMVAITCIVNYYCAYMFVPFMVLYIFSRRYINNQDKWIKLSLIDLFEGLIGIVISAFVLLPCAHIVISSPRMIDESHSLFSFIGFKSFFRYFSSLFIPYANRIETNLLISNTIPNSGIGWVNGSSLYTSILFIILFIPMFFTKKSRTKKVLIIDYAIALIFISFFIFYKLFQGTFETRWFYMFIILNVLSMLYTLNHLDDILMNKKLIYINLFIVVFILLGLCLVSYLYRFYSYDNKKLLLIFLMISLILIIIYTLLIKYRKLTLILIFIIFETIYANGLALKTDANLEYSWLYQEFNPYTYDFANYLKNYEEGFYRVAFSSGMNTKENFPEIMNLKSNTIYSSLYNYNQEEYLNRRKSNWKISRNEGRYRSDFYDGIKYWGTIKDSELIPFGYGIEALFGDKEFYRNKYYMELGYVNNRYINKDVFNKLSKINQEQLFPYYVIGDYDNTNIEYDDSLVNIEKLVPPKGYSYKTNNSESGTNIIVELFGMPMVEFKILKENEVIIQKTRQSHEFVSLYIDPSIDFDEIQINILNVDPATCPGMNVYLETDFSKFDKTYYEYLNNSLHNITYKNDYIYSELDTEIDGTLVTSIPYDKGWKVYLDNEEVDVLNINQGFVGIDVKKGFHKVEFKYMSPYFMEGTIISAVGIITYIIYLKFSKKVDKEV